MLNYNLKINKWGAVEVYFNEKPSNTILDLLKANGFKWFKINKCWSAFKSEKETKAILNGEKIEDKPSAFVDNAKLRKANILKYVDQMRKEKTWGNDESMYNYCLKSAFDVIILDSGEMIEIENLNIETRFCFGYGQNGVSSIEEEKDAFNMQDYANTNENYFIDENMKQINDKIEYLENSQIVAIRIKYNSSKENSLIKDYMAFKNEFDFENRKLWLGKNFRLATDQEKQKILDVLNNLKVNFEKRLKTYLKRYGLSKIDTWTYLVD